MSYIGSTPTTQSFIAGTDYFNGTGSQVAFTLSRSVNSVNDIEVIVNNVEQIPSGYSVSGTTLTFSAAPSSGTSNVYVRYLSTTNLSLAIPAGTSATFNTVAATSLTATTLAATNVSYTGTLTGGTGVVNLGSGQVYKDASGNVGIGTSSPSYKLHAFSSSSTATVAKFAATNYGNIGTTYIEIGTQYGDGGSRIGNINTTGNTGTLVFETMTGTSGVYAERARIDSSGNLSTPLQSAFITHMSAGSTAQVIPFNTATINRGSNFNTSTYTYTAPVSGLYYFNLIITYSGSGTAPGLITIYVNGGRNRDLFESNSWSTNTELHSGALVYLTANDSVYVWNEASGNIQGGNNLYYSQFSGNFVG